MSNHTWSWRFERLDGTPAAAPEFEGELFSTQAEAETWVGDVFVDLLAEGVDALTLFEGERQVYGPMSLHP